MKNIINIEKIDKTKPIVALGLNSLVEEFAKALGIDVRNDIVYIPETTLHYTQYAESLKEYEDDIPPIITTQNKEMLDVLLESDLDFQVITVYLRDEESLILRIVTKEDACELQNEIGLELR